MSLRIVTALNWSQSKVKVFYTFLNSQTHVFNNGSLILPHFTQWVQWKWPFTSPHCLVDSSHDKTALSEFSFQPWSHSKSQHKQYKEHDWVWKHCITFLSNTLNSNGNRTIQINCFWAFLILENVKLNILFTRLQLFSEKGQSMPCGSIKIQQKLDTKVSQFDPVFGPIHFGLEANTKCVTFSMKSLQGRIKSSSL